jgi:uncharacterized protein (DUF2062 family)
MSMSAAIKRLRALAPRREQLEASPGLRWLAPFLANPKLWQWSRRGVAAGLAIGLFIGVLVPAAQMPLAAALAVFLRVNLPVALAGTLVTNPVTFAPIYFAAYLLGAWATGVSAPFEASFGDPAHIWNNIGTLGVPLLAGLGIAATVTALAAYLIVWQAWAWRVASKRRARR